MLYKFKGMLDAAIKYASLFRILNDKQFENQRLFGELLRNVHSIEKGLSLHKVRAGFGYEKITEAFTIAIRLSKLKDKRYNEAIQMFESAIDAYISYHESIEYTNEKINKIKEYHNQLTKIIVQNNAKEDMGGFQTITKREYNEEEYRIIQSMFYNRHSVREFSKEPLDSQKIYTAIELAHHCPSACNRQSYRVHIIPRSKFDILKNWFDGVGGFAEELDKIILITGDLSMYRIDEKMQYIVSSSVYAAYLTLSLEAQGIGCCFIQRPVVVTKEWKQISKDLNISGDEQIVCALGLGNLLNEYKVPISHRLSIDTIVTEH